MRTSRLPAPRPAAPPTCVLISSTLSSSHRAPPVLWTRPPAARAQPEFMVACGGPLTCRGDKIYAVPRSQCACSTASLTRGRWRLASRVSKTMVVNVAEKSERGSHSRSPSPAAHFQLGSRPRDTCPGQLTDLRATAPALVSVLLNTVLPVPRYRQLFQMGGCSQCRGRTSTVGLMAQAAEEEQNRATFLQMARVWFALAERKRHAPTAMAIQRIKCRSYLPQLLSKLLVSAPGARNARCRSLARRSSCNLCSYAFLHDFEQNRSIHFRCTIKPS